MTRQQKKERKDTSDEEGATSATSQQHQKKAKAMLSKLLNSMTLEEAETAMRMLADSMDSSSQCKQLARSLADENCTAAIVVSLEKHRQSKEFCLAAVSALVNITYYEPQSSNPIIVGIGGIHTLLNSTNQHNMDATMTSDVVELLCNFASLPKTRQAVATQDCMDFVIKAMRAYPDDEDTQLEGCEYLLETGKLAGVQEMARERRIGGLLGNALDNFPDGISQKVVIWYAE